MQGYLIPVEDLDAPVRQGRSKKSLLLSFLAVTMVAALIVCVVRAGTQSKGLNLGEGLIVNLKTSDSSAMNTTFSLKACTNHTTTDNNVF